jgi:hypothetical protein
MVRNRFVTTIAACGVVIGAAASGACNREREAPAAEMQTQTAQPANRPMTISGCLKAGEGEQTFILSAARTEGSTETANYELVGATGVNLRDHVGHQVEIDGTLRAQQDIASHSGTQPAERATGTTGTPTVSTKTEIDVKRLDVSAVRPLADQCASQ